MMVEVGTLASANPAKIAAIYSPTSLSHIHIPPSTIGYAEGGDIVYYICPSSIGKRQRDLSQCQSIPSD